MHPARIGITTSYEDNRQSVDVRYAYAVEQADGLPILGPIFRQAATARARDGAIEAIESDDGRIIGAQFHPERMDGRAQALFDSLIQQAQSAKAGV